MEEAPEVYRVTEVPKGNIPADELLYRVLEPGPLSCDRHSQIQVGPLTVYPSLGHPKDAGPAGQTGLCTPSLLTRRCWRAHCQPASLGRLTCEHQHPQRTSLYRLGSLWVGVRNNWEELRYEPWVSIQFSPLKFYPQKQEFL